MSTIRDLDWWHNSHFLSQLRTIVNLCCWHFVEYKIIFKFITRIKMMKNGS